MTPNAENLKIAIIAANHFIDPDHTGPQWPDPVDYDTRPLSAQALELLDIISDDDVPEFVALAAAAGHDV